MKVLEVSARKGGVGTSTVAVSIAVALSQANPDSVLLVDNSVNADTFAIAGLSFPSDGENATLGQHSLQFMSTTLASFNELFDGEPLPYSFVVVDAGTSPRPEYCGVKPFRVGVVSNSYLSLRAESKNASLPRPDAIVCVHNDEHALNRKDVKSVLQFPIIHYFGVDNSVARAIDAGLYADHRSHLFAEWTASFLREYRLAVSIPA